MKKRLILIIVIIVSTVGLLFSLGIIFSSSNDLKVIQQKINLAKRKDKYLTFDDMMDVLAENDLTPSDENINYLVNFSTFKVTKVTFDYASFNPLASFNIKDTKGNTYVIDSNSKINYEKNYLQISLYLNLQKHFLLGTSPAARATITDIITVKNNNAHKIPENDTLTLQGTLLEQHVISNIVTDSIYYYYEEELYNYGVFLNEYITNGNMHYYYDLDLNRKYLYNDYVRNVVIPYNEDGSINLEHESTPSTLTRGVVLPGCDRVYTNAFKECEQLMSVYLPTSVEKIYRSAFQNCFLEQILLPSNLKEIEIEAFSGCKTKKINIPLSVTKINTGAFSDLVYKDEFQIYTSFDSTALPDGVKTAFGTYKVTYKYPYDAYRKYIEYLQK